MERDGGSKYRKYTITKYIGPRAIISAKCVVLLEAVVICGGRQKNKRDDNEIMICNKFSYNSNNFAPKAVHYNAIQQQRLYDFQF